ncbi:DUF2878 domain-containing protein, partial [Cognatilysobacter terrigena]
MARVLNVVGFQLAWWATVLAASRGGAALGVLACAVFVIVQAMASPHRVADVRTVAAAVAMGLLFDGALVRSGWVTYAADSGVLPAPAWILALWAAFAITLNHALAALRPSMAAVLGAVGGPLSYLAAERLGAIALVAPRPALVALALGWALATGALVAIARRARRLEHAEAAPLAGG